MASWTGVITNVGANLIADWANGSVLNIDKAVAGTGVAPMVSLLAQTALVEEKQIASIMSSRIDGDARKIKIQIPASSNGYMLNQIGLFASKSNGEQVLLALFQNESGIAIPCISESPNFLYIFYCILKVSNQGEFSITVDPSAIVDYSTMQDFVGDEIKKHNSSSDSHQDIRQALAERDTDIQEAISNANTAADKANNAADTVIAKANNGDFDGQDGRDGTDGTNGTNGRDGKDGKDGVSPTVAITPISGGHRVTITDATGVKQFDVYDGNSADGDAVLPPVTSSDNGKFLRVVNGAWAAERLINAEEVSG